MLYQFKRIWLCLLLLLGCPALSMADHARLEVLSATFPMHQMARNITAGQENVHLSLMLPAQLGCPHDYVLTPMDMRKISGAQLLIINGLGLESFLGAPVQSANAALTIFDSSTGIRDILHDTDGSEADHHGEHAANPHLFASPRMAARLTLNIATELSRRDPAGAGTYMANAEGYAAKLNQLADDFAALGRRLKNNRIVTQHGVFDYLARDMGLTIVAVVAAHAGQEPSAAEMIAIIATIKREEAGAIFAEPQYPARITRTIAAEAGIPMAVLDPVATGPDDAPLDYYETVMRRNLKTLEEILGTK